MLLSFFSLQSGGDDLQHRAKQQPGGQHPHNFQPEQRPQPEPADPSHQQQLLLDRIRELELRIAQLEANRPHATSSDTHAKRFEKCVFRVELKRLLCYYSIVLLFVVVLQPYEFILQL